MIGIFKFSVLVFLRKSNTPIPIILTPLSLQLTVISLIIIFFQPTTVLCKAWTPRTRDSDLTEDFFFFFFFQIKKQSGECNSKSYTFSLWYESGVPAFKARVFKNDYHFFFQLE